VRAVDETTLRALLRDVARGAKAPDEALAKLRELPFAELGYATVDHHRTLRQGLPEVVYGAGKTAEECAGIAAELHDKGHPLLVTRLDPDKLPAVQAAVPDGLYHPRARLFAHRPRRAKRPKVRGEVLVVSAGTSDRAVAEEAVVTLQTCGHPVRQVQDVGVAGLHRLLAHREALVNAPCIIAVAGMEGALPTAVAGLVPCPVIAVPTSVGYGAALHGFTALLGMLTSCAPNVAVVNVDNGFGAGMFAATINRVR